MTIGESKWMAVYITASKKNGTLYVGSTSDLIGRIYQHKNKTFDGFTAKYGVDKLVYFECTESTWGAVWRERRLKKWNRAWKVNLIEKTNPNWDDLYESLLGQDFSPAPPGSPAFAGDDIEGAENDTEGTENDSERAEDDSERAGDDNDRPKNDGEKFENDIESSRQSA